MSTKIRNGRIIRASLSRTYEMLLKARDQSDEIGRQAQAAWITRRAVRLVDEADLAGKPLPSYPLVDAWGNLLDAQKEIKTSGRRNPDCDFEFELWLFPVSNRRTLVIVHTERKEFSTWFDSLSFVQDYSYWDDTDPDEGIGDQAWSMREKDWDMVLPSGGAPSDRCLTYVMFNDQRAMPPSADNALQYVEHRTKRASRHATIEHVDEVYRRLLAGKQEIDPGYKPEGFSLYFEAKRLADADSTRRENIKEAVCAKLRDITARDLWPTA